MGTVAALADVDQFARIVAAVEAEEDSVAGAEAPTTLSNQCKIQVWMVDTLMSLFVM